MKFSIKNRINLYKSLEEKLHPHVLNSKENKNFLFSAKIYSNKIMVSKFEKSNIIFFTEGLFGKRYPNIFKRFH